MARTENWSGAIFPMTTNPKKEEFKNQQQVLNYLNDSLQDPKDHRFYYGVHYEAKDWERVKKAWRGEIMLFPFPSNKLVWGSTVFFKWKDILYAYGTLERVISNNRNDLGFPLDITWDNKVYPYIVKFLDGSIHVRGQGIPAQLWCRAVNRVKPPRRDAYLKLSATQIESLLRLF